MTPEQLSRRMADLVARAAGLAATDPELLRILQELTALAQVPPPSFEVGPSDESLEDFFDNLPV